MVELNPKRITSLGISLAGGDQLQREVRAAGEARRAAWGHAARRAGGMEQGRTCIAALRQ